MLEQELGIQITPAGLCWHLNHGRLRSAVKSRRPWRLRPDALLVAYPLEVRNTRPRPPRRPPTLNAKEERQQWRQEARGRVAEITEAAVQRGAARPTEPRAATLWLELEKARKLQAERIAFAGQYIDRRQVEQGWAQVVRLIEARVDGIADHVATKRPDLGQAVIDSIRRECRDALEAAFGDRLTV
ncbi:MAG: hypothetical protein AAFX65_08030 [Cyanobacteria bacterium J06638_7]